MKNTNLILNDCQTSLLHYLPKFYLESDYIISQKMINLRNFLQELTAFKYHVFAPMGRFQLELINCPSQETEVTSTPTRPVDNVVIQRKAYRTEITF